MSSLRRIETPDDKTVRFVLSRVDTQFGWALASPTASIVDEESYDADQIQPAKAPIVGSGPFQVVKFADDQLHAEPVPEATSGATRRGCPRTGLSHRPRLGDDRGRDDQRRRRRGLARAGRRRRHPAEPAGAAEPRAADRRAASHETVLTGTRVLQLQLVAALPRCGRRGLRQAIAVALQGDRTSDSVVPGGVPGHLATFPLGGKAKPEGHLEEPDQPHASATTRRCPNAQDIATQIRTRLEDTGGLSVQLRPGEPDADLTAGRPQGVDRDRPGLAAALSRRPAARRRRDGSIDRDRVPQDDRTTPRRMQLLGALQKQAAVDLIVLPISQSDEHVYTRGGVEMSADVLRPGLAARAVRHQQWLTPASCSGVRTGEFARRRSASPLTDHKGRRHSIVLAEGGQFHTTKGAVAPRRSDRPARGHRGHVGRRRRRTWRCARCSTSSP